MKSNVFTRDGKALVAKIEASPGDRVHGDLCPEDRIRRDVERAVAAIGGFERLVEPGDTVLVKPNFNTADPPPASSDPVFVRALIELLTEHGAGKVILGESSMISRSTRDTLRQTGMLGAAEEAGAEVISFGEGGWATVRTGGHYLKKVGLAKAALNTSKIVYACCLKTHFQADFTGSLKLAMGFVRPRDRVPMHLHRLKEKLAELNLAIAPDLILVDGRRCFIAGGPMSGEVREPGLILASGDRIAIDVEGVKVIQSYPGNSLDRPAWELPMIRRAVELGLGATSDDAYQVVALKTGFALGTGFALKTGFAG
jgi:uncharacterized protein (DUF362 family)